MFPAPALTIGRLCAPSGGAQPVIARLAAEALASEVAEALPPLPPQSLLFVRRVELRLPSDALSRVPDHGLRRRSAEAARNQLAVALAGALRPASECARDDADAVLFADEGEMLACLARDALAGHLDRWWWRSVLGRGHPDWTPAWRDRPASAAAALGLLARAGLAASVQAALADAQPCGERPPGLVGRESGATAGRTETQATRPFAVQPTVKVASPRRGRNAPEPPAAGTGGRDTHALAPVPAPRASAAAHDAPPGSVAAHPDAPEIGIAGRSLGPPPAPVHDTARAAPAPPAEAPSLQTSPAAARDPRSGDAPTGMVVGPGVDVPLARRDERVPPATGAVPAATGESRGGFPAAPERPPRGAATAWPGRAASVDEAVHPVRADAAPNKGPLPAADRDAPPDIRQPAPRQGGAASARGVSDGLPMARDIAAAGEVATATGEPAAWLLAETPRLIVTRCARLLFLVNLLLGDGLYPDFTRPAERGFPVSLWRLLALLGKALAGPEFRDDPLHAALIALAGEAPSDPRLEVTDLAASWPIPEPPRERRLRARSLRRQPRRGFAGWFARYRLSVRRRLAAALSTAPALVGRALWQERGIARVWISAAEVVAILPLPEHPVAWRLAGLDRDPGHLPSTGRSLRFIFE